MNRKAVITPVGLVAVYLLIMTCGPGCANVVPPQGGPRDSIPPILIKSNPGDSTTNFTGNRIVFTFDDYVDAQAAQQELIISPTPRIPPSVDYRLNTVTVRMKDSLESNTTYILNFGNGIKDITEGNVSRGFTYIFSTGPSIDSLELRGKVVMAETGSIDSTLIVMLHRNPDDSAVINEKPRYVTKLDGAGNFVFRNLPAGTFYVYALKDDAGGRRYIDSRQVFAFGEKPVQTNEKNEPVLMYAYSGKLPEKKITSTLPAFRKGQRPDADKRLKWQTNLSGNLLDLRDDLVLSFDQPLAIFDSSKLRLSADSAYTDVTGYSFVPDTNHTSIRIRYNWKENTSYHLVMDKDFAQDTSGRKLLKTDTLDFKTRSLRDYGKLRIKFRNLDLSKNPVLLLSQGAEKRSYPLSSADFSIDLFSPGDYQLSLLQDDNKNGKWDPGEFFGKHKQPEIVKPIGRRIVVKAGVENEFEIIL
jgi:hypothetical protein